MARPFVHLNVHTEYSLLEATSKVAPLAAKASSMEMSHLAMTDRGNLFGGVEFFQKVSKAGIKPIIGCEVCIEMPAEKGRKDAPQFQLILLCENETGYQNLAKLVSYSHLEREGGKPTLSKAQLRQYREGLIGLSCGLSGELGQAALAGKTGDQLTPILEEYLDILGKDNFYIELQDHGLTTEKKVCEAFIELSKLSGVPLVTTNDVHYVEKEHYSAHDILLCIQSGAKLDDDNRPRFASDEYYLKSAEEMEELFGHVPEALDNTLVIAERCQFEMGFGESKFPAYPLPPGEDPVELLKELCEEGLKKRYPDRPNDDPELRERLQAEYDVIIGCGFTDYFLITWDFIKYAKDQGIPVGPGRGSAAGSLVSYLMEITELDPLRYGLLFERFLNPERISPPDVDVDFCQTRRGEVIQYVREKYGDQAVAQIITFGTLGAKMAIRDVGRVMGMSFGEVSRIADQIPKDPKITIEKALHESAELKRMYEEDEDVTKVINTALTLEGVKRQTGIHAAGVVIADRDLTEYLPLTRDEEGIVITQYSMEPLTDIGMLKMDFLGLKTLTVIQDCLDMVESSTGNRFHFNDIPLEDPKTFELLNRAENIGVFQVESPGMRRTCMKFDIRAIDDIIALIALYRPGPMDLIDDYVKRKKGEVQFEYEHALLEKVCGDTFGIMIYQEQVMGAARELAGYSLGEADLLRRAMGKKKVEEMDRQRVKFVDGAHKLNGLTAPQSERIFNLLEKFAGYGFNKSHSAAYSLVSYHTAYLKANYPVQFMAALMSNDSDNTEKISLFVAESRNLGIRVQPPSINHSEMKFTVAPNEIRFGMCAIKNVGEGPVSAILKARREGGDFTSMEDFCKRVEFRSINKKTIESLVKCGAFDDISPNRRWLFEQIDDCLSAASSLARDKESGQGMLLDMMDGGDDIGAKPHAVNEDEVADWPLRERLEAEKILLGFYVSGHPIDEYEADLRAFRSVNLGEIDESQHDQFARIAGVINGMDIRTGQRDKRPWAIITVEDRTGGIDVMVFADLYEQFGRDFKQGNPIILEAFLDCGREDSKRAVVKNILPIEQACNSLIKEVHLLLRRESCQEPVFDGLKEFIGSNRGAATLLLYIPGESKGMAILEAGEDFRMDHSYDTICTMRERYGSSNVKLKVKDVPNETRQRRWGGKNGGKGRNGKNGNGRG